jgi:hypothetical protein
MRRFLGHIPHLVTMRWANELRSVPNSIQPVEKWAYALPDSFEEEPVQEGVGPYSRNPVLTWHVHALACHRAPSPGRDVRRRAKA